MKKINKVYVHIFDIDVIFVVDTEYKYIKKWAKKQKDKPLIEGLKTKQLKEKFDNIANFTACFLINDIPYYFIVLESADKSILLHEITHFKQMLFEDAAIEDEGEFEAYFMQSTYRQFSNFLQEK